VGHPFAVPFIPMTVSAGALFGWVLGVPDEKSKTASETLLDVWSGTTNVNVGLAEDLCRLGALRKPVRWKVSSKAAIQSSQQTAIPPGEYMLEFTPIEVQLADSNELSGSVTRNEDPNPPLRFIMRTTAKVVRLEDGEELASFQVKQLGRSHHFLGWAKDGGNRLTLAIAEGQRKLAEEIINLLFPR